MNITEQTIIGELVATDYRTASVFKKYGIDFCCNGNRRIADACDSKKIDAAPLINALLLASEQNNTPGADYNSWPPDLLADYIVKKHHRYVTAKIPEIVPFLHKVARVHGGHHPELKEVELLFNACAEELTQHMQKEEKVLFPYISKMMDPEYREQPPFGSVEYPISMMMNEHTAEGERFRRIAELTNNYTPPEDACNTYRVTLSLLREFEEDLHLHIHLENNILFPRAIAMEQAMQLS